MYIETSKPINCNLLVIGKTGSGKSSLSNYFFGKDVFTTGVGKPVTQWSENFQHHWFNFNEDIRIGVSDTVGLEPNNLTEWKKLIVGFLNSKKNLDDISDINNMIHICFYVINAASARVEEKEFEIIEDICKMVPTSIVLTNCDNASLNQIEALEKEIKERNRNIKIFRVCSISRTTRGGKKITSYGKDGAVKQILKISYETAGIVLFLMIFSKLQERLKSFKDEINRKIDNSNISIFNIANIEAELENVIEPLEEKLDELDIENLLPKKFYSYQDFLNSFDVESESVDIFERHFESLTDIIGDISISDISIMDKLETAIDDIEYGGFFDKVGGVIKAGKYVLFIKNTLKEIVNELFTKVDNEIDIEGEKILSEFKKSEWALIFNLKH